MSDFKNGEESQPPACKNISHTVHSERIRLLMTQTARSIQQWLTESGNKPAAAAAAAAGSRSLAYAVLALPSTVALLSENNKQKT